MPRAIAPGWLVVPRTVVIPRSTADVMLVLEVVRRIEAASICVCRN
jgi:hypothetical protein